jgi:hypothetical protein
MDAESPEVAVPAGVVVQRERAQLVGVKENPAPSTPGRVAPRRRLPRAVGPRRRRQPRRCMRKNRDEQNRQVSHDYEPPSPGRPIIDQLLAGPPQVSEDKIPTARAATASRGRPSVSTRSPMPGRLPRAPCRTWICRWRGTSPHGGARRILARVARHHDHEVGVFGVARAFGEDQPASLNVVP